MGRINDMSMIEGPFLKKIIVFSIPIMLNSLLQTAYSTADSIVVGRFVGSDALAAVSSNGPLWFLLVSFFIGLTSSAGVLMARGIGAKNDNIISNSVHTSVAMSLIFGFSIMILGFFMARQFLTWMSVPENIIDLSTTYLKIIFLGCPANIFYNAAAAIFRGKGQTKIPLVIQSTSGIINVILNLVFVVVFKLSVEGVALSTIISQYISAIWFGILLVKSDDSSKLYIKKIKIHKEEFLEILHIGIPSGISQILGHFANVTMQSILNTFGSSVIAGCSASTSIINMIGCAPFAVNNACSIMSSQNYGAKSKKNIKRIVFLCATLNFCTAIVLSTLVFVFRRNLLGFFTTDISAIDAGSIKLIFELSVLFISNTTGIFSTALISMKKSVPVMIYGIIMTLGVRFVWYLFVFPLNPVLYMLYILTPISAIIGIVVYLIMYSRTIKRLEF